MFIKLYPTKYPTWALSVSLLRYKILYLKKKNRPYSCRLTDSLYLALVVIYLLLIRSFQKVSST